MNILVTGSDGQLGNEIKDLHEKYTGLNFYFTDINDLDITNLKSLEEFVQLNDIEFIVNCAAYTAVDKAEDEPKTAELINAKAVYNLVKLAEKFEIKLIHISTDYVFDGTKNTPYLETDPTCPNSVYGRSKLKGERIIEQADIPWIIIRTSWLYSSYGNNFVKTMLRLAETKDELIVVFDQVGTPTYARNLAEAILEIIMQIHFDPNKLIKGIYHFSNQGVCSWYDFAVEIFKKKNIDCKINPVLSIEFPTKAIRPSYSVLNKQKISKTFNLNIPHWIDGLEECLKKI